MFGAYLYKLGAYLAIRLPRNVSERIVRFIADLQYFLRFKVRRSVIANQRIVHGNTLSEKELRKTARSVFRSFARTMYWFLRLPALGVEELKTAADTEILEMFSRGLSSKGGFIMTSAHMGPWEIGGVWLAANGFKVNTVALDHPSEPVTVFFNERRELFGMRVFPLKSSFMSLKHALDRGECIVLLVDRSYGGTGRQSRWFGRDVSLPIGHLLLAMRCRVPVVTSAFVFDVKEGFKLVIKGVHYPDPQLGEKDAIKHLQSRCLEDLESLVKEFSDQWYQFTHLESSRIE
ncbi:MAG: hypothetical protein GTO51_05850 [Candidatus Latescibacteria bacterium]|nr:hypothetical protein [Candidatus Latescibacterota bacterium]NIM21316.1 hypothetical protein [Candidatus Latescibacterota bacterium]NIM65497.1 hypothetical protein [Candidatus Latescibacterota bacterium]NIO01877.1 hypothetical protein [Candidatus Latescibacterota bacterium]NIO28690.1 hypothetical protein [Candidatus Latescibacterota bacterium]